MAHYLVRAEASDRSLSEVDNALQRSAYIDMHPFGKALTRGLSGMRRLPDGRVAWEEEDYCSPPLAMEREAVLDEHFENIEVEPVEKDEGWRQLRDLPRVFPEFG